MLDRLLRLCLQFSWYPSRGQPCTQSRTAIAFHPTILPPPPPRGVPPNNGVTSCIATVFKRGGHNRQSIIMRHSTTKSVPLRPHRCGFLCNQRRLQIVTHRRCRIRSKGTAWHHRSRSKFSVPVRRCRTPSTLLYSQAVAVPARSHLKSPFRLTLPCPLKVVVHVRSYVTV